MTVKPITSGQTKQIHRMAVDAVERALNEVGLDNLSAQRIVENGDELTNDIRDTVSGFFKKFATNGEFSDEEVESRHDYPYGFKPKSLEEQIVCLCQLFPQLNSASVNYPTRRLPKHAEGWFAFPRWKVLGKSYNQALCQVLAKLTEDRQLSDDDGLQKELGKFGLTERTGRMLAKLEAQQAGNDILVVPAQFGRRHKGRSLRRVRESLISGEFCLGAFEVVVMLLVHPERLLEYNDLGALAAGCEDFEYGGALHFACGNYDSDLLGMWSFEESVVNKDNGAVSGFLLR